MTRGWLFHEQMALLALKCTIPSAHLALSAKQQLGCLQPTAHSWTVRAPLQPPPTVVVAGTTRAQESGHQLTDCHIAVVAGEWSILGGIRQVVAEDMLVFRLADG